MATSMAAKAAAAHQVPPPQTATATATATSATAMAAGVTESLSKTSLSSNSKSRPMKILFLSSDTGGGHRASAESLAKQFQLLFPGATYDLLDVVERDGVPPYNSLVSYYKHLSAHPSQWKVVYSVSNSRAFEMLADAHLKLMCERAVRKSIQSYDPDVVVSVHPLMTNVPVLSCSKISNETGKHLPMFTVVTDLGSAHCLWFASGVEKMFVGSTRVQELAQVRGKVPSEKVVLAGLPIRHEFGVQAAAMGDRWSAAGQEYIQKMRDRLDVPNSVPTILIMGGGEGVGSLSNIVDSLYVELTAQGIHATLLVVTGRNEKLKADLDGRDWPAVVKRWQTAKERNGLSRSILMDANNVCGTAAVVSPGCIDTSAAGTVTGSIRRILSQGHLTLGGVASPLNSYLNTDGKDDAAENKGTKTVAQSKSVGHLAAAADVSTTTAQPTPPVVSSPTDDANNSVLAGTVPGQVNVIGLGFITNMADYMVAADVLVSKAGPGTISEAASLSLPVMLTSFLPGQEEGNVDYVVESGFGAYCSDSDPLGIAEEVCMWLTHKEKLKELSRAAKLKGAPYAARDIAKAIGESTLHWMEINDEKSERSAAS